METKAVRLCVGARAPVDCTAAIVVPEKAIHESGLIKMISSSQGSDRKHEFHALAQTALIRFQDEELEMAAVSEPIRAICRDEVAEIAAGMAIGRTLSGELVVFIHEGQSPRRLLEAAHRFCTRWVRLDI